MCTQFYHRKLLALSPMAYAICPAQGALPLLRTPLPSNTERCLKRLNVVSPSNCLRECFLLTEVEIEHYL